MLPIMTHRQNIILAALAAAPNAEFAPVQIQKLFFLLDENAAESIGGRQFAFEPYDYGPFDKALYQELDFLETRGLVNIAHTGSYAGRRRYHLTPQGLKTGESNLAGLAKGIHEYMSTVSEWVRSLTFEQLVGSIYRAYPEMRVNSVFQD